LAKKKKRMPTLQDISMSIDENKNPAPHQHHYRYYRRTLKIMLRLKRVSFSD
jgi:hypothetical protein